MFRKGLSGVLVGWRKQTFMKSISLSFKGKLRFSTVRRNEGKQYLSERTRRMRKTDPFDGFHIALRDSSCSQNDGENLCAHTKKLNRLAEMGRVKDAKKEQIDILNRIYNDEIPNEFLKPIHVYNTFLKACAAVGDTTAAQDCFEEILREGCEPTMRTYGKMIHTFAKAGDIKGATMWEKKYQDAGFEVNSVIHLILTTALLNAGKVELAKERLNLQLERKIPCISSINAIMVHYVRKGNLKEVIRLHEEALKSGAKLDNRHYHVLIMAFVTENRVEDAERFFKIMINDGITPSVHNVNLLIEGWANTCEERARSWFRKLGDYNLRANIQSFNQILKAIKNDTLSSFAVRDNKIKSWFEENIGEGMKPDKNTYVFLIQFYSSNPRKLATAEKWFNKMMSKFGRSQLQSIPFHTLIRAFGREKNYKKAEEYYKLSKQYKCRDVYVFSAMLEAMLNTRNYSQPAELYKTMCQENIRRDNKIFHSLMKASAAIGNRASVLHWFDVMQAEGLKPDVMCYDILARASRGRKEILDTYRMMLLSKVKADIRLMNTFIQHSESCTTENGNSLALFFYNELGKNRIRPDRFTYMRLLSVLSTYSSSSNQNLDDGKELENLLTGKEFDNLLRDMKSNGIKLTHRPLSIVTKGLIAKGDFLRAIKWLTKGEYEHPDKSLYVVDNLRSELKKHSGNKSLLVELDHYWPPNDTPRHELNAQNVKKVVTLKK